MTLSTFCQLSHVFALFGGGNWSTAKTVSHTVIQSAPWASEVTELRIECINKNKSNYYIRLRPQRSLRNYNLTVNVNNCTKHVGHAMAYRHNPGFCSLELCEVAGLALCLFSDICI